MFHALLTERLTAQLTGWLIHQLAAPLQMTDKMSKYFNLYDLNYNSLSDSKIKQLVDLAKKKYVS